MRASRVCYINLSPLFLCESYELSSSSHSCASTGTTLGPRELLDGCAGSLGFKMLHNRPRILWNAYVSPLLSDCLHAIHSFQSTATGIYIARKRAPWLNQYLRNIYPSILYSSQYGICWCNIRFYTRYLVCSSAVPSGR